jgi:hypothetical protein
VITDPAGNFPNPAGHQLEERPLIALGAQPIASLSQHPGHLIGVVPRLIDDHRGAAEERQRRGEDSRRYAGRTRSTAARD